MNHKNRALNNDLLIQDLVLYELTKGTTIPLKEEDLDTLQHRFTEYKGLIKRGEFTYDQLADRIYGKYGITTPLVQPPELKPDQISNAAFKEAITEIKEIVKKERKINKPCKWYVRIWNKIQVILSRFYISI